VIATVVDTKELWETVVAAFVAGVGVTASFSFVILGAARFAGLRRADRPLAAGAFGALAVVALIVALAAITLGMIAMLSK